MINPKGVLYSFLRWGLRLHVVLHIFEFISAMIEGAHITATLVVLFAMIQISASFLLPHEHIHVHSRKDIHEVKE